MTAILVLLASAAAVSAQPISAPHVTLDLVAESASIKPSQDFSVGLHFKLEEGWHVYWTNPGDSGEPPRVQWELPPGFHAGSIEWPYPRRLPIPPLMDYGYEDQVLLPVRIRPPKGLQPGDPVKLSASIKWVVCREVCISEKGQLALTMPVSKEIAGKAATQPSANQDLFVATWKRIPQPPPPHWRLKAMAGRDSFVLSVQTGRPVRQAAFFPAEPLQIENAALQQMSTNPRGGRLTLKKSEQLSKSVSRLRGVVILSGQKAYLIDVPVTGQRSQQPKQE